MITREKAEIMLKAQEQEFKFLQQKKKTVYSQWRDIDYEPEWNWREFEYRIKPYCDIQKDSGLQVGDTVQVLRTAKNEEAGWPLCWISNEMDQTVYKTYRIIAITEKGIRLNTHRITAVSETGIRVPLNNHQGFFYPSFVLKKIGYEYVPFDFENGKKQLKEIICCNKDYSIITRCFEQTGSVYFECGFKIQTADDLLQNYTFIDGTPCGMKLIKDNKKEQLEHEDL